MSIATYIISISLLPLEKDKFRNFLVVVQLIHIPKRAKISQTMTRKLPDFFFLSRLVPWQPETYKRNFPRMLLDKNFVNHSVVTGVREITECPARACTFNPKFFRDTDNAIFQSEEVLVGDPEAADSDDNLEDEDEEEYSTPPTSRLSPSSAFSSPSSTETFASSSPCDNDDLSTLASTSSVSRYIQYRVLVQL